MKRFPLTVATCIAFSCFPIAEGIAVPIAKQGGRYDADVAASSSPMLLPRSNHLVQNPAECAPDQADPVWDPGHNRPVGFSCFTLYGS